MSNLISTLLIAFALICLAVIGLAISLIITGRSKIQAGSCGKLPKEKQQKSCGTDSTCSICRGPEAQEDDK